VIIRSPVLTSLDYSKYFQILSFASEDTVVGVLPQKNDEGKEQPISFMSKALHNSELNYIIMEKHAYTLVNILRILELMSDILREWVMFLT
jgi:hypothetical protein